MEGQARQYNSQKKRDKQTYNNPQKTYKAKKNGETQTPQNGAKNSSSNV
jgi:hypothetical protein